MKLNKKIEEEETKILEICPAKRSNIRLAKLYENVFDIRCDNCAGFGYYVRERSAIECEHYKKFLEKKVKCPFRISFENNGTTFREYEHNERLKKCVNCNGYNLNCQTYVDYIMLY